MFLHSVNCRILRRSCGDYANFSYVELDKVLRGEKITTVIVSSEEECELACIDELQCKSINIEKSRKARQCELNKRSTADASDGVVLTPKSGWMFKSTSFTENLVWTEQNTINFVLPSTCKIQFINRKELLCTSKVHLSQSQMAKLKLVQQPINLISK